MKEDKDRTPIAKVLTTKCTKCKMELNHTVVTHNGDGIVEKVKCNTCGSEHKYRSDKKKAAKKGVTKKPRQKKVDPKKDFELLSQKYKDKKSMPYSMSGTFEKDDVIDHNTFGRGYVIDILSQKMEVVFSDRSRILVFNR
jgi:uncharacterized Zn finger protein (UPF0148 family)